MQWSTIGIWFGIALMTVSEVATVFRIEPFWSWNTPIAWTGFILFADATVFRARGNSWLGSKPKEFLWLAAASIPLWLVFEFYNRYITNWFYVGLPENRALRLFGYAWSFSTIWPAIFEAAELVAVWRRARGTSPSSPQVPERRSPTGGRLTAMSVAFGATLLVWPLVRPSPYLAAPVWLGFIFLLDPINRRLGAESLGADLARGRFDRLWNLLWSGVICGALWEFWNYWAGAKWHYTVPIMERLKVFEMPLPGYMGFPAFAVECFTMYVFVRAVSLKLLSGMTAAAGGSPNSVKLGRTIAL